ncbi:MAG: bifunctional 5,10-methylenetetrahydrofolate dehydrogenase/5,10-methenyltetrahydrofolate cyclohydrolase [Patescibacteria group bacterium]
MNFLYGKSVAERILGDVKKKIAESGITPGLAVVLVGDDKASQIYISLKEKKAREIGFYFEKHLFLADAKTEEIVNLIKVLNGKPNIHGILVQLPLPPRMDTDAIITAIAPAKDADGFHKETIEKFLAEGKDCIPIFPRAILEMAKESGTPLNKKKAVIVVNSALFGNVLQKALESEGLTVKIIQSTEVEKHKDALKEADVVVTACGRPGLIKRDMVPNAVLIIDGGISEAHGKTVGDLARGSFEGTDILISPVPGGVGPVTVACLLRRTVELAGVEV